MLQMICRDIEFGDVCGLDGIQAPNNVHFPFGQLKAMLVHTATDLKLFGSNDVMLSVNDHELFGLDLILGLWLLF